MCERFCVRGLSFGFPVKQGTSPQEVILGRKITLVHCRCSFLSLFSDIPNGVGVLFVMKYVPIGFLNINPRRPINKCNAACRRSTSRSFAIQTWVLQVLGNHCPSHRGCPGLDNTGCVKAAPVWKCPVTPGQKAGSWRRKVFPARCSGGHSESYQDKPLWSLLGKYIANCSFEMELACLRLLLKVAILQRSAVISETESCRNLCKDHNWFLKYYQRFDNPESLKKKSKNHPLFRYSFVRPIILKHIVMSSDIFSMRIIC